MCAWSVYGDSYDNDTDFSNGAKSVRFKLNANKVIRYARTWVVLYNDPGLTNITAKIYHDLSATEAKGDLIASSSTTHTKAEITTSNNAIRELYFQFADISLEGSNYYHFVLTGTSSGFSASSHIAWKTSYPDPVYEDGVSVIFSNLPKFPYTLSLIGAGF